MDSSSVLHNTSDNYHCISNVKTSVSVYDAVSTTFLINSYQPCAVALRI
jgi:hypothetical protein